MNMPHLTQDDYAVSRWSGGIIQRGVFAEALGALLLEGRRLVLRDALTLQNLRHLSRGDGLRPGADRLRAGAGLPVPGLRRPGGQYL